MELEEAIDRDHPSFGCDKAVFIFHFEDVKGRDKNILVEASNGWAVALLERLAAREQWVSDFCFLQAVIRDPSSFGIRVRNSLIQMSLVDFVLDVVNRDYLMDDVMAVSCLARALSDEEKEHLNHRLDSEVPDEPERSEEPEEYEEEPEEYIKPVQSVGKTEKVSIRVVHALCSLGFSKKDVEKWAVKFDPTGMSMEEVMRAGCKAMTVR